MSDENKTKTTSGGTTNRPNHSSGESGNDKGTATHTAK